MHLRLANHLSDTFLIKAGGVVRAAQATDGSTRSAGTTTTYHQLICALWRRSIVRGHSGVTLRSLPT